MSSSTGAEGLQVNIQSPSENRKQRGTTSGCPPCPTAPITWMQCRAQQPSTETAWAGIRREHSLCGKTASCFCKVGLATRNDMLPGEYWWVHVMWFIPSWQKTYRTLTWRFLVKLCVLRLFRKIVHSFPDEFLLLPVDLLSSCHLRSLQTLFVKDRLLLTDTYQ